jgi:hypothetical protein
MGIPTRWKLLQKKGENSNNADRVVAALPECDKEWVVAHRVRDIEIRP